MNNTNHLNLKPINDNEKINWFPGHMHKSTMHIKKIISQIDLIIEIRDARAIEASANHELLQFFLNKPVLEIYLKNDLADNSYLKNNKFLLCAFDKNFRQLMIKEIEKILKIKLKKLKNKGLINPIIQILVCGLPNLGKSTIINKLVEKNVAQTADSPGWTKSFTKFKFYKNMWVYDTPGIFYKTIKNNEIGYQLALIGAIKREVIPLEKTVKFAFLYLKKNYLNLLENLINQKIENLDFNVFIEILAKQKKIITKKNTFDLLKTMWFFYDLIRTGKIGLISWN